MTIDTDFRELDATLSFPAPTVEDFNYLTRRVSKFPIWDTLKDSSVRDREWSSLGNGRERFGEKANDHYQNGITFIDILYSKCYTGYRR